MSHRGHVSLLLLQFFWHIVCKVDENDTSKWFLLWTGFQGDLHLAVTQVREHKNNLGVFLYPLIVVVWRQPPFWFSRQNGVQNEPMKRGNHVRDGKHRTLRRMWGMPDQWVMALLKREQNKKPWCASRSFLEALNCMKSDLRCDMFVPCPRTTLRSGGTEVRG